MCCVVVVVVKFLMAMVKISTLGRTCMCCVAVVIFYLKYIYSRYTHDIQEETDYECGRYSYQHELQ